jgi:ABC-type uncharacterized transport system ATPase subunit
MMTNKTLIRMIGITKKFPGVVANNNVDFDLHSSEIHSILGENGAGKTTLMNILCPVYWKIRNHRTADRFLTGGQI